jgi:hypothetical protein
MKKITVLCLVLVLLAASAIPVMAARGGNNGHGNGQGQGHGNNGGDQDQQQKQDQIREQNRNKDKEKNSNPGSGGNGNHEHMYKRSPFYLQGTISALDAGLGTVTVTLTHGNAKVKEYIGTNLTLQTNESTMIFQITQGEEISGTLETGSSTGDGTNSSTGDGTGSSTGDDTDDDGEPSNRIPITFDQLAVGQYVAIHGNLVDQVYTARLITVYIREPVEP